MTYLTHAGRPLRVNQSFSFRVRQLARYMKRYINNWVAAAIAHRERQAALFALRHLDDRNLKDMGLYRGNIDNAVSGKIRR